MAISNFLNLLEESVDILRDGHTGSYEEVLEDVLEEHLRLQSTQNNEDDEQSGPPVRTIQEGSASSSSTD